MYFFTLVLYLYKSVFNFDLLFTVFTFKKTKKILFTPALSKMGAVFYC